jgi:hypothetical protein
VTRETYLKFVQEHPEQFEDVPIPLKGTSEQEV